MSAERRRIELVPFVSFPISCTASLCQRTHTPRDRCRSTRCPPNERWGAKPGQLWNRVTIADGRIPPKREVGCSARKFSGVHGNPINVRVGSTVRKSRCEHFSSASPREAEFLFGGRRGLRQHRPSGEAGFKVGFRQGGGVTGQLGLRSSQQREPFVKVNVIE
jgi:hypothetical protein